MSFEEIFTGFIVALSAGALIGLERQQDKSISQRRGMGGVRTFPLIALAGALSSLLTHVTGVWSILGALLVVGALLGITYYQDWHKGTSSGIATPIAALVTFLLGVLALVPGFPLPTGQRYLLIVASAAVVMALLSFKEPLHQAVARISDDDIYATAKFVILALVMLPLLPNRTFGPLEVLNPFGIGLMVVLIAGLSFLGYIATRVAGAGKGLVVTGILGGLVSSTAVTMSMASHARKSPTTTVLAAMAILTACSTMFLRMLVIVGIVNASLLPVVLLPLGVMTLIGYVTVLIIYYKFHRKQVETEAVSHRNPFELTSAIQFGLLYAAVLFVAKGAQTLFGDQGLYASSVLAGTTDVDAITLSVIEFYREGLSTTTAVTAMTLAAITNTAVKTGLSAWIGGSLLSTYVAPGMLAILGGGGLVIFLLI